MAKKQKPQRPQKPTSAERMLAGRHGTGTRCPKGHDAVIVAFVRLAKELLPLADQLASDEFTAEERARVRHLAGEFTVFDLKNLLVQLCGERVRMTLRAEDVPPPPLPTFFLQ